MTLMGLLDLSAAFDAVDHDILINRLRISYGLDGIAVKWLESFERELKQTVIFNNEKATTTDLMYGVPQVLY